MKMRLLSLLFAAVMLVPTASAQVDLSKPRWAGNAICYSGYRQGQDPDKSLYPTKPQVLEDLRILERNWKVLRLYGSDQHSKDVLETIRTHGLGLRVMLGIWLSGKPQKAAENRRQESQGIKLANAYPGIVVAVSVGNEALVSWSDHQMKEGELIKIVDRVKASVKCAVTVADDYLYWIQPGNKLVSHLDFITLHSYPIWGRQDIDEAFGTTIDKFADIQARYPGKTIVFGEVGWATYTVGDKHVPRAGSEAKQKRYYDEISAWGKSHNVTCFIFEAFDEPWKGKGTEGHWGLFSVDRKAKLAMQELFPDLMPTGPTSPGYGEGAGAPLKPSGK